MIIFLVGFMGSGKSSLGKVLSNKLKYTFYDMDKILEERNKKSVGKIFAEEGEEEFRKKERALLEEIVYKENAVISTGGGVPCFYDNMELINKTGISVYLEISVKGLFSRLKNKRDSRPLIKDLNDEELMQYIEETLKEREKYYLNSDLKVNGLSVDINELIKEIERVASEKGG